MVQLLNEYEIVEHETILNKINNFIENTIKQYETKRKIILKYETLLLNLYPDYMPTWVKENIEYAMVVGSEKKTIVLPDGRKFQMNNKLNNLSGTEWIYFTNSDLNTRYPTSGKESFAHKIRKIHPTTKPPQLMRDIIIFFTKEN